MKPVMGTRQLKLRHECMLLTQQAAVHADADEICMLRFANREAAAAPASSELP